MGGPNLDETKIDIIVRAALYLMQRVTPHGYTFDSVELLPYERVGEGFVYKLWVRDSEGKKVVGQQDSIAMHICHGVPGSATEESLKTWEENIRNGKYAAHRLGDLS